MPLNWRLTDRSQQSEASLSRSLLELLRLAGERLTASALETLLESPALQGHFQLSGAEMAALHPLLQRGGFHWGLDAEERGGLGSGSLSWVIDRLLLGLVLPCDPGLAPGQTSEPVPPSRTAPAPEPPTSRVRMGARPSPAGRGPDLRDRVRSPNADPSQDPRRVRVESSSIFGDDGGAARIRFPKKKS